ncbi:MAG: helix-turn-helix transcriptional regulator, partial [Dehalococcoidia bacterium]|nr:helix-turn-helix transcriptional regulator [Dehalococcoidia bacterium]
MKGTFGQYLREQRRKAGISQRELARRVTVDFSYISNMENARLPPPTATNLIAIADV